MIVTLSRWKRVTLMLLERMVIYPTCSVSGIQLKWLNWPSYVCVDSIRVRGPTRLIVAVGKIIKATQQNENTDTFRKEMDAKLTAWEKCLPERLKYSEGNNQEAQLLANMLSLGFQYLSHKPVLLYTLLTSLQLVQNLTTSTNLLRGNTRA